MMKGAAVAITCRWCGTDEYVAWDPANDVAICDGPAHEFQRMWEPANEPDVVRPDGLGNGIAAELGLYEDLPGCLRVGEWAETGVVEHRYGAAHPREYAEMVGRWGHVCQGRRQYSVTTFIGSTLGALSRSSGVASKKGPGTGFFSYNAGLRYWTLKPVPPDAVDVSWAAFARTIGCHPDDWPLLGFTG